MINLKDNIESMQFDTLCKELTAEISQVSTIEYRLKAVLVLMHIIEVSRKTLNQIDITYLLASLKQKIREISELSDIEKNQLLLTFMQDVKVVDAIDSKNSVINELTTEIKSKIDELEDLLERIVKQRDNLSLPELNKN